MSNIFRPPQYSDDDQQWRAVVKAARAAIRLRHSIEADAEINSLLGPLYDKYQELCLAGRGLEFDSETLELRGTNEA